MNPRVLLLAAPLVSLGLWALLIWAVSARPGIALVLALMVGPIIFGRIAFACAHAFQVMDNQIERARKESS